MPIGFTGETLEMGFNADFLRDGLESLEGDDVRVKLISPLRPAVIQGAQHAIYPPTWLDGWPESRTETPPGGWLVFIVAGIPRAEILAHFAFAGATPWDDPAAPRPHHPHHHPIGA